MIEKALFDKLTDVIDAFRRGQGNRPQFTFSDEEG